MRLLHVVSPGPRTTVEDLGRRLVARHGVPAGGAFDGCALIAANRLLGNADDAAGLEAVLGGPTLRNDGDEVVHVALIGADFAATIVADDVRPALRGRALALAPGATLRTGFARDGARLWLGVAGGLDVPIVLGARATCLAAGFGGLDGRPLARGDALPVGRAGTAPSAVTWRDPDTHTGATAGAPCVLRVVPGPQRARFPEAALDLLCATTWTVQNDSDRTGVRLAAPDGAELAALRGVAGIAPEGTTLGAIQVPADGRPIVLGPDRPVTGGYAKPALVVAADVGRLARLRPGDSVRFAPVSLDEARALAVRRRAALPGSSR